MLSRIFCLFLCVASLVTASAQSYAIQIGCGTSLDPNEDAYLITESSLPLSKTDWADLESLIENEIRFRTAVQGPLPVNMKTGVLHETKAEGTARLVRGHEAVHDKLLGILNSEPMMAMYNQIIGRPGKTPYIRAARINLFEKPGHFLGKHSDSQNDPEIKLAGILYVNNAYRGGELAISGSDYELTMRPPPRSLVFIKGDTDHAVLPLQSGKRLSIAFFVGLKDAP